jgi:hypothetical protein
LGFTHFFKKHFAQIQHQNYIEHVSKNILISSSNNFVLIYDRGGQPFEQVGQISDIKVLAGQKSAQKKIWRAKKKHVNREKSNLYLVCS